MSFDGYRTFTSETGPVAGSDKSPNWANNVLHFCPIANDDNLPRSE
jgi:hypothetical protein